MLVSRPWFGILAEGDIITAGPRGSQWVAIIAKSSRVIASRCAPHKSRKTLADDLQASGRWQRKEVRRITSRS